uniref:Trehalase n=1 Tax=Plectus sambesii TaxID=2011161 RepID=A0A914UYY9_9BILA
MWSEENGVWFDYDRVTNRHVACYYDTNFFPLFTGCAHEGFDGNKTAEYLDKAGVLSFPGGLPSSLVSSGQQWDFPNAWAPTTWVVIQGLRAVGQDLLAQKIAEKWIKKNYNMWKSSGGRMFEKYNVESQCFKAMGGGGEYEMQEGFGWTNGVILDLLLTYSDRLSSTTANTCHANCECQTPTQTGSTVDAQSVCEDHPDNT